ncbi:hypothetical protein SDJN03_00847, partial [Cucurbita argyrosperma subsp. sororia]
MEVKVGQRNGVDGSPLLPQPILSSLLTPHRNWANAKASLKNQFRAIALFRDRYQLQEKLQSSLNGLCKYQMHLTLACPRLPPARTTSLVVLVPLIVFCAKCIIGASYARVFGTSRLKPVKEPEGERHNFRSGHWRSALREIRELDGLDSESSIYSTSPSEEQQISVEDLSHAYKKLDQEYDKFLSECGLSKWGYWRGGAQRPGQE